VQRRAAGESFRTWRVKVVSVWTRLFISGFSAICASFPPASASLHWHQPHKLLLARLGASLEGQQFHRHEAETWNIRVRQTQLHVASRRPSELCLSVMVVILPSAALATRPKNPKSAAGTVMSSTSTLLIHVHYD